MELAFLVRNVTVLGNFRDDLDYRTCQKYLMALFEASKVFKPSEQLRKYFYVILAAHWFFCKLEKFQLTKFPVVNHNFLHIGSICILYHFAGSYLVWIEADCEKAVSK